jgi:hypothetical protein
MSSEPKTQRTGASVDAFLDTLDNDRKREESRALIAMMQEVSGEPPELWGPNIIGFGVVPYAYESGRTGTWPMIGFSPRKRALSLYVLGSYDGKDAMLARLGKHSTGVSCLYVNKLSDIDMDVLREMVVAAVKDQLERRPEGLGAS